MNAEWVQPILVNYYSAWAWRLLNRRSTREAVIL